MNNMLDEQYAPFLFIDWSATIPMQKNPQDCGVFMHVLCKNILLLLTCPSVWINTSFRLQDYLQKDFLVCTLSILKIIMLLFFFSTRK